MAGADGRIATGDGLGGGVEGCATEADAAGFGGGLDAAGPGGGPVAGPGATDAVATEAETATAVVGEWLGATDTVADAAALEAGCGGADADAPAAEVAGTPDSADLFRDARLPDTESLLLRRLPATSSTSSTSES